MFKKFNMSLAAAFFTLIGLGSVQVSYAEDAKAPKWYDTVNVSGFVDGYYSYNMNGPQSHKNAFHNFDFVSNDFNVSLVELNIVKPVDETNRAGFYIGLAFGEAADAVACAGTIPCPATNLESTYKNFRQAYASMLLMPGLQLDFGKFVTQHGSEVIESKDNWNYTRSILFAWAIPYYHTGARLTYTLNDQLTLMGDVVNGWNSTVETNNGKTYGIQAMVTPVKSLPIIINYMTGPEIIAGTVSDTKSLLDVVVTYNVTDSISLMANYDDGIQKQGLGVGAGDAKWSGYALYGKYAITPSMAIVARVEQLDDKDGFATATNLGTGGQKLKEGTLTLEHSAPGGCLVRLDLRQDKSDQDVFTKEDGTPTSTQNTVTLGVVHTF
ncbi:MAG: porin [Nitrospirae bacterium]|nr:porin [Nitrospirota bacterium]MBI3352476.1 porin [Nitrospirota bacterium]